MRGGGRGVAPGVGLAAGNGGAAEGFDGVVEGVARLLAQDASEQRSKGAYIAS
jgi:hypothetical protein